MLDTKSDKSIKNMVILLTDEELNELRDSIDNILNNGSTHEHVMSVDGRWQLTVAIYDAKLAEKMSERFRNLIEEN